ncbi:MAG: RNB domain-containing ribonuclease [Sphingomonadaceae bacterium]
MKALCDPDNALGSGLAAIRSQFKVPAEFPPDVAEAAERAAQRKPDGHVDRTDLPFVTLDPATSTDLDQAFTIERSGSDLILHYAIADVAWFVGDGDAIDTEAWKRGTTLYLPDGKARLYPASLSEKAASLLPDGQRPAVVFTVKVDEEGNVRLDGAERALIRSTAKLAYDTVRDSDLPPDFAEFARRIDRAEDRRGAARVDPPEQEVVAQGGNRYALLFRPRMPSEDRNAALSLAANLAIADALLAHGTGLFRVMAGPDERAVSRLRNTAKAFGLSWPANATLTQFERTLQASNPKHAAFMLAVRRAGNGAAYAPYADGVVPWHAGIAATYAHATAPLRRLADRYVVRATLSIANGRPVETAVTEAFSRLPGVMARAGNLDGQVERAVIDLAEAVMLEGDIGRIFPAIVTDLDDRGARIQLRDLPVVARVDAHNVAPGADLKVRLESALPAQRSVTFQRVS